MSTSPDTVAVVVDDPRRLMREGVADLLRDVPGIRLVDAVGSHAGDGLQADGRNARGMPDGPTSAAASGGLDPSEAGTVVRIVPKLPVQRVGDDRYRTVALDEVSCVAELVDLVLGTGRPRVREQTPSLTMRERSVVAAAGDGLTARQIAARLHISPRTVERYMSDAIVKLGAVNQTDAVARFVRMGLRDAVEPRREAG